MVTDRINAETVMNFTSWAEFYGPLHFKGDNFSLVETYNLTDSVFDYWALDIKFGTFGNVTTWKPRDVTLLTDGTCDSACTLFVELMTQQKGVHTVVIGGRPQNGPMQIASGSRGAAAYTSDYIIDDMQLASQINQTAADLLSQKFDTGMSISYAGINLRDQIKYGSTTPNQFLYLPAECRIFWSMANWYNYTQLWVDTYNSIYGDQSLCVPGSLNVTLPPNSTVGTKKRSIALAREDSLSSYINSGINRNSPAYSEETTVTPADTELPPGGVDQIGRAHV